MTLHTVIPAVWIRMQLTTDLGTQCLAPPAMRGPTCWNAVASWQIAYRASTLADFLRILEPIDAALFYDRP